MATAIILTAGHGSKLWPYSVIRPKCLIPISNRPLLVHQVEALQSLGFERIIVAGHSHEQSCRNALYRYNGVEWMDAGAPKGSAKTLYNAMQEVTDKWVTVLYGDVFVDRSDLALIAADEKKAGPVTALVAADEGGSGSGTGLITADEDGHGSNTGLSAADEKGDGSDSALTAADEKKAGSVTALVAAHQESSRNYIGCNLSEGHIESILGHSREATTHHFAGFRLSTEIMPYLENVPALFPGVEVGMMPPDEFFLEAAIIEWMRDGHPVKAAECRHPVFDIDKPWHILQAGLYSNRKICGSLKQNEISEGASIDPSAYVRGMVRLGKNSVIGPNVIIEGNIWAGDNTKITHGAILKGNNVIGDGCEIGYSCYIDEGSTIGNGCKVLHAAELSGILFDKVYLHHYMEISGIVGENTDIGAGTVCGSLRFDDGLTRHIVKGRPEHVDGQFLANACYVGDYARTGVNSMLMPGAKTGARSIVGPGVVLSSDLDDNELIMVQQETVRKPWGPDRYGW